MFSWRGGSSSFGVIGEDGCGGPARVDAGTWWSADGAAWTRASLPGSSTDPDAVLTIVRISDRVIVATQSALNGSHFLAWTSSDGRTWSAVSNPSRILTREPVSDGRHAAHMIDPESGVGAPSFERIDEDGQLVRLLQSGHGPMENLDGLGETFAVGPTGIVAVRYDGGSAWLGLPS